MPLRVISYDGADYRAQIRLRQDIIRRNANLKDRQEKEPVPDFYPVISIVLYFGLERWNKPLNLKSCFAIPEGLEDYVNDYEVHIFEVAFLSDETISMFKSDFRQIAEFFAQSRKIKEGTLKEYTIPVGDLVHAKEVMELMSAMTGDHSFEDSYNSTITGRSSMWTLIDYVREQKEEAEARLEEEKARADEEKSRADEAEADMCKKEADLRKAEALIAELQERLSQK